MTTDLSFAFHEDQIPKDLSLLLFNGLNEHNFASKNLTPIRPFGLSLVDRKEKIVGGITGATFYGCLYIDMLWIESSLRRHGYGKKAMQEVEKLGIKRGCTFSTVSTMDFEALSFYQHLGYAIEFTRSGFEKDSKMFFLRKTLSM